jgi:two-component system, OmpR family, phosphate regulon sensor histidine kinase PhoR
MRVVVVGVIVAVAVLAFFTLRTTLQLETLRRQSVLEATLGLATEKAARLDRNIVDQDNVVMSLAEPEHLEQLSERWIPTSKRETPTVRSIVMLDSEGTVLAYATRTAASFGAEQDFRRLLVTQMLRELELSESPITDLRHLHREFDGQSYLISYWQREWQGRRYIIVAWHDIGRLVRETLATLYGNTTSASRMNVVDYEGRIIFGPPLRSGDFTVGVRFPTTLYNWRLQVALIGGEELASRVKSRRSLEIVMLGFSCLVVVAGLLTILIAAERERRVTLTKSDFVANVSHELKTPLALIRMFAELLQGGRVGSDAKRQEYLDIILRESERLTGLIENVLDFARIERGRHRDAFSATDLRDVVTDAVAVHRYRLEQAAVVLQLDLPTDLPQILADRQALGLVVQNLIDNALKYAADGGKIDVRGAHQSGWCELTVRDYGPGIPPEDRERIFERFVRGDLHRGQGTIRGSGIGLALVKHIAENHSGSVACIDVPDGGVGTCFLLRLPLRAGRQSRSR